jgi:hypothetical protein
MKSKGKSASKAIPTRVKKIAARKSRSWKCAATDSVALKEMRALKSMDFRTRRAVKALFELKGYL